MIPCYFMTTSFPSFVKTLSVTNYEDSKKYLDLYFAISNLDLALRTKNSNAITNVSTKTRRTFNENWENSNRVCLKVISFTKDKSTRYIILESGNARDYLKCVGEKFTRFEKAKKCEYLSLFHKTNYDSVSGMLEHINVDSILYNKLRISKLRLVRGSLSLCLLSLISWGPLKIRRNLSGLWMWWLLL